MTHTTSYLICVLRCWSIPRRPANDDLYPYYDILCDVYQRHIYIYIYTYTYIHIHTHIHRHIHKYIYIYTGYAYVINEMWCIYNHIHIIHIYIIGILQFGYQAFSRELRFRKLAQRLRAPWPRSAALWGRPLPPRATDLRRRSSLWEYGAQPWAMLGHVLHEIMVKLEDSKGFHGI
jgi:hypothetical protein